MELRVIYIYSVICTSRIKRLSRKREIFFYNGTLLQRTIRFVGRTVVASREISLFLNYLCSRKVIWQLAIAAHAATSGKIWSDEINFRQS